MTGTRIANPQTGLLDFDQDRFFDWRVSNLASYGSFAGVQKTAGTDCYYYQAAIRPDAQELPNRLNDNCNGIVDDLLGSWWTPG